MNRRSLRAASTLALFAFTVAFTVHCGSEDQDDTLFDTTDGGAAGSPNPGGKGGTSGKGGSSSKGGSSGKGGNANAGAGGDEPSAGTGGNGEPDPDPEGGAGGDTAGNDPGGAAGETGLAGTGGISSAGTGGSPSAGTGGVASAGTGGSPSAGGGGVASAGTGGTAGMAGSGGGGGTPGGGGAGAPGDCTPTEDHPTKATADYIGTIDDNSCLRIYQESHLTGPSDQDWISFLGSDSLGIGCQTQPFAQLVSGEAGEVCLFLQPKVTESGGVVCLEGSPTNVDGVSGCCSASSVKLQFGRYIGIDDANVWVVVRKATSACAPYRVEFGYGS
jgi:hypothetical protein